MIRERGNILFLILLAVVLFAALTYAVTGTMTVKDQGGMSNEAADSAAADILGWFAQIDSAVMRMRLSGNIPVEQIDFYDTVNFTQNGSILNFDNTYCTTTACQVFSVEGGGVGARHFEQYAEASASTNNSALRAPGHKVYVIGNIANLGTSANDVVIRIDFIKRAVCRAINRRIGLAECPSVGNTGSYTAFSGNQALITNNLASPSVYVYTGDAAGQPTFCTCSGTNYGYVYHAVIER